VNHVAVFLDLCDNIDASLFSGDILMDDDVRADFKGLLERWAKKTVEWDDIAKDFKASQEKDNQEDEE
jgi:hypothetical protein